MKQNYRTFEIVAKTLPGLETVLASEIEKINGHNAEIGTRMVKYYGDMEALYRSNFELRTALRILMPIKSFKVRNEKDLYKNVKEIDWQKYIDNNKTLAVDSTINSEFFNHANYIALKTKDAIVDKLRDLTGARPSVNVDNPDLRIHVHILGDDCTVSLDSSGSSLHKRGWRQAQVDAPMNEVLAAGIVMLTGWNGDKTFIDAMCGSGTITMEAAAIAINMPPGMNRSFNFEKWNDFDDNLWRKIRKEARDKITAPTCDIFAYDISKKAINIAKTNAESVELFNFIKFGNKDFFDIKQYLNDGIVFMNPPYGIRNETENEEIIDFYKRLGDKLKQDFAGFTAWVFSGSLEALKFVGLKPEKKIKLFNGMIECRLNKFNLFKGTWRDKRIEEASENE
jgi:putative N6-adenine-specific DNA methylase